MRKVIAIAVAGTPLWIFCALGLIFDTADFLVGFGVAVALVLLVIGSLAAATKIWEATK